MENGERIALFGGRRTTLPSARYTQLACGAILLTVLFERITFYAIVGNLVLFLNGSNLQWTSVNAIDALFIFTGVSYMTSLFGGWLSDSFLGKFKTLIIFLIIYIGGVSFMPFFTSYPNGMTEASPPKWCSGPGSQLTNKQKLVSAKLPAPGEENCSWAVYLSLVITGICIGAFKANIAPFGHDQVKHEGVMMRVFINWYYWCVNLGALISLGLLAYVQQEISFFWGYVAPAVSLLLALIILICGCKWYIIVPARGSVLTNILKIIREAFRIRRLKSKRNPSSEDRNGMIDNIEQNTATPGCLDFAKLRYGGSFPDSMVDDLKKLGKIFLVFLTLVPYWLVYFQMESTYQIQGLHMKLNFIANQSRDKCDDNSFSIPNAWLSLFDVIFLIILIPIMDRIIYPKLDAKGYHLSLRMRIAIGMVFSILSICTAGILEMERLKTYWKNDQPHPHYQCIGPTLYKAANLSIFLQIPQYALIGISEVFTSVAGLELACSYAPISMKGSVMGLFWFTQGVGSFLGTTVMEGFRGIWFFNKDKGINCRIPCEDDKTKICHECHLDYYFFVLGGLQALGMIMFIILAWKLNIGQAHRQSRDMRRYSQYGSNGTSRRGSAASLLHNPAQ